MSTPTLPDFLIIGVQKSGTTWLHKMLQHHASVFIPDQEVHFFDKGYNYEKGLDWYASQFADAPADTLIGEKTPDYIWAHGSGTEDHLPTVHENIHTHLPDIKLIVILRDPVKRAISAVRHILRSSRISPRHSVDDVLVGEKHHLIAPHGVIEYGHYADHLSAYLDLFDRSQMLILFFEETVVQSTQDRLQPVWDFLDIDFPAESLPLHQKVNTHNPSLLELYAKYYVPRLYGLARRLRPVFPKGIAAPSPETIATLVQHYRPYNERLEHFLGRPLPSQWLQ